MSTLLFTCWTNRLKKTQPKYTQKSWGVYSINSPSPLPSGWLQIALVWLSMVPNWWFTTCLSLVQTKSSWHGHVIIWAWEPNICIVFTKGTQNWPSFFFGTHFPDLKKINETCEIFENVQICTSILYPVQKLAKTAILLKIVVAKVGRLCVGYLPGASMGQCEIVVHGCGARTLCR